MQTQKIVFSFFDIRFFDIYYYCIYTEKKQQEMDSLTKLLAGKRIELEALKEENKQEETFEKYKEIDSIQVEINSMLMQQMAIGKYMYYSFLTAINNKLHRKRSFHC
jgi:hypothetical protein